MNEAKLPNSRPRRRGLAPPRKKTCSQCERSKVRCDLKKPTCSRCKTRQTNCEYPAGVYVSVDTTFDKTLSSDIPPASVATDIQRPPSTSTGSSSQVALKRTDDSSLTETHSFHSLYNSSDIAPFSVKMENHSELIELPIAPPADWNKPDLDFENQDLIPMPTADDIATRWTRPYLTMSTESAPKDLMPFTIDSIKRHLKFTISKLNSYVAPHYIHYGQLSSGIKEPLVKCFRLVRLLNHAKEDVHAIQREIHQEMKNIYDQGPQPGEMDRLCTFQVYLTYMIALYLSPFDIYAMSQHEEGEFESHVRLQEIACICARTGITSEAEESNTRPTWESWILTSAKRRTLFTMYLFTNIYNWKKGIPNYVAEELRGAFVPDGTALWRRHDRTAWEQEYNAHLLRWSDGKLAISELWRDAETGSATRRDRVDRWLEKADEFGRELFSICAQIHGY